MLKIEFTASSQDEIQGMAHVMAGFAAALGAAPVPHVQPVSVSDTSAKRGPGRPRKVDPVDAYVAAGGVLPGVSPVASVVESSWTALDAEQNAAAVAEIEIPHRTEPAPVVETPATLESEIVQAEATFNPEAAPPPVTLDELRAQIRTIAQDRGALWLRPLLEADKVTKVSGLTEATMRAALEAAQ